MNTSLGEIADACSSTTVVYRELDSDSSNALIIVISAQMFISSHLNSFTSADRIIHSPPAVLPKPKKVIASRFRSGSADEEDLAAETANDFRWVDGKVRLIGTDYLLRDV